MAVTVNEWGPRVLVSMASPGFAEPVDDPIPDKVSLTSQSANRASKMDISAPSAGEVMETTGGVLSMLIPDTMVIDLLPAESTVVPLTLWRAPSLARITSPLQLTIAVAESAHAKVTATSVLFHPLEFDEGEPRPVMAGGEVSSTMTTK
jgi:hypothetical protein